MPRLKINYIPNHPSLKIFRYYYSCSPYICCHSSLWRARRQDHWEGRNTRRETGVHSSRGSAMMTAPCPNTMHPLWIGSQPPGKWKLYIHLVHGKYLERKELSPSIESRSGTSSLRLSISSRVGGIEGGRKWGKNRDWYRLDVKNNLWCKYGIGFEN